MRGLLDLPGRYFGNAYVGISSQWAERARGSLGVLLSRGLNGVGESGVQHPDPGGGPCSVTCSRASRGRSLSAGRQWL